MPGGATQISGRWTKHESLSSLEEARLSVFKPIETFYNREIIHQTNSPDPRLQDPRAMGSRIRPGSCGIKSTRPAFDNFGLSQYAQVQKT